MPRPPTVQGQVSVTAAVALAGYDIMQNQAWRVSDVVRVLDAIRVAGSTAGGDCSFNLFIGSYYVGRFYVIAAGWPTQAHETVIAKMVPPGANIVMEMITAPTTNPINVVATRRTG